MNWMLMPFRRFADFEGRSRRMEYWMFTLLNFLVIMGGFALAVALSMGSDEPPPAAMAVFAVLGVYVLATIIPSLAVQVRRFHDQGKSGWFILLGFIPGVGGLILIVFMCIEGERGSNQYGDDPKQGSSF